jgi:hypothetical protein
MKRERKNMINGQIQKYSRRVRSAMGTFAMLAMWATNGAYPGVAQSSAQPSAQPAFPSAAEAGQKLFFAVQSDDEKAIANILGGPTELTTSRDQGQDKLDRELFAQRYEQMHRLGREADGSMTLYIGAENWPFPIPLVEENGGWRFDPALGLKEVLFRRIGENELTAIAICHEFVAAEKQYRAKPRTASLEESSPTSMVARAARESTGGDPVLFRGYYFHVVATGPAHGTRRGGFAFIAYPAEYRSSGVMTFIVTDNDIVYEKDLGANTVALASVMSAFHKDASWSAAGE